MLLEFYLNSKFKKKKKWKGERGIKKETGRSTGRGASAQVVLVVKNPSANVGDISDAGLIPGLGRFPGEGNGSPL